MKKVFFIGQYNTLFEETNNYLVSYFNVQVCVDSHYVMKSILKLSKPDLFLISMLAISQDKSKILNEIRYNYPDVPVICMCPPGEPMTAFDLEDINHHCSLEMPVDNEVLVETICDMLGIKYDHDNKQVNEDIYHRKCVLAVDDNVFQLRMLNELLKDRYDVQLAESGMKALTLIGKRVPDIILLDYEMPICDGKMTLQMIREIDEAKDVPVIFLTGVKDSEHIKAVLDLHPAGYILKPAKNDLLIEEIEKHLL